MGKADAMKPILFNTEMVQAVLEGRKTVTRRIIKTLPSDAEFQGWLLDSTYQEDAKDIGKAGFKTKEPTDKAGCKFIKSPYKTGDILYVRETWVEAGDRIYYKADGKHHRLDNLLSGKSFFKWKPSIHMPKGIVRIFLKVKDVRVERLQDMCVSDCVREGVETGNAWTVNAKPNFIKLWNSTVRKEDLNKYSWDINPWVWVIEFERMENKKL